MFPKQNLYQVIYGALVALHYHYNVKRGKMSNPNFSVNICGAMKKIGIKSVVQKTFSTN